jgi:GNAT superfamily N-acetyltransferase
VIAIDKLTTSMQQILVKTTYLEMLEPIAIKSDPLPHSITITRHWQPSTDWYLNLYSSIGKAHAWVDRSLLPANELRKILESEHVEIHSLQVEGREVGFAELDRHVPREVQIVYFGILPQYLGQGLGRKFLRSIVGLAWSYHPSRVWLHTCELDHPAALPNYLRAGFSVYDEKYVPKRVFDDTELPVHLRKKSP